ncbi:hypothetical protein SUDANB99_05902 [Streptomyces sp. enrichment culture]
MGDGDGWPPARATSPVVAPSPALARTTAAFRPGAVQLHRPAAAPSVIVVRRPVVGCRRGWCPTAPATGARPSTTTTATVVDLRTAPRSIALPPAVPTPPSLQLGPPRLGVRQPHAELDGVLLTADHDDFDVRTAHGPYRARSGLVLPRDRPRDPARRRPRPLPGPSRAPPAPPGGAGRHRWPPAAPADRPPDPPTPRAAAAAPATAPHPSRARSHRGMTTAWSTSLSSHSSSRARRSAAAYSTGHPGHQSGSTASSTVRHRACASCCTNCFS